MQRHSSPSLEGMVEHGSLRFLEILYEDVDVGQSTLDWHLGLGVCIILDQVFNKTKKLLKS